MQGKPGGSPAGRMGGGCKDCEKQGEFGDYPQWFHFPNVPFVPSILAFLPTLPLALDALPRIPPLPGFLTGAFVSRRDVDKLGEMSLPTQGGRQ